MSRWENGEIEAVFDGSVSPITDDFADNFIRAYGVRNGWVILYVEYEAGDEDYIEVQLYSDNSNRRQLLEEDPLYEKWYAYSSDGIFPAEGNYPADLTDHIAVRALPWRFEAAGLHRLMILMLPREDAIKVAVRSDVESSDNCKVTVRFCTDEISWGGVGQGDE